MVSGAVTAESAAQASVALHEWARALCRPLADYSELEVELIFEYFANAAQQDQNPDAVLSAVAFLIQGDLKASGALYVQIQTALEIALTSEEIEPEVGSFTTALFEMYHAYITALDATSGALHDGMTAGEAVGALTALAVDFGLHPSVLRLVEELDALSLGARVALRGAGNCGVLTQDGSEIAPGLQI